MNYLLCIKLSIFREIKYVIRWQETPALHRQIVTINFYSLSFISDTWLRHLDLTCDERLYLNLFDLGISIQSANIPFQNGQFHKTAVLLRN